MTATPPLRLVDLAVPFGAGAGLAGISLDVAAGERLAIVGPSGAGKTTLLRAIAGFVEPSGGRIELAGVDAAAVPPERRNTVYLHQTPLLFPHLSVRDNVAFPLRVRRVPRDDIAQRVTAALASVRLDALASRAPHTLSGGQRHRVALARAIVARPALLLLDEPLASLDPVLRDEVREAIVTLQEAYRPALVLVTHDIGEAGLLADRIGVLLDGTLAQIAAPAALFARPASLAVGRFLGMANVVDGAVGSDRIFRSELGEITVGVDGPSAGLATALFGVDAVRLAPDPAGPARVTGHRHRPERTTTTVSLGATTIEAAATTADLLPLGSTVRVSLDPRMVSVFPSAGTPPT